MSANSISSFTDISAVTPAAATVILPSAPGAPVAVKRPSFVIVPMLPLTEYVTSSAFMYTSRRRYFAATFRLSVSPCSSTALVSAVPLSASVTLKESALVITCSVPLP